LDEADLLLQKKCFDEASSGPIVGAGLKSVLFHSVKGSAKSFAAFLATVDHILYFGLRSFFAAAFGLEATAKDLLAATNCLHFGQKHCSTKDFVADFVGSQGSAGRVVVVDFGFMEHFVPNCFELPHQVWLESEQVAERVLELRNPSR
jgi:hypothetical protein